MIGRPRTTMPPDEEIIKLGKEMVEWVKNNKPSHLSEWYVLEKGILRKDFKEHYIRCEAFRPYYEQAMVIIGKRYNECDGIVPGIAQRWMRIYFPDLMHQENEDAIFNAKIKSENDDQIKVIAQSLECLSLAIKNKNDSQ